jgi:GTP cyclohydrolase I
MHLTSAIQQTNLRREQALEAIRTLLDYIGEDPARPGLARTPERVLRAWERDWGLGYRTEPPALPLFVGNDINYDELVLVRGIRFFSTCEHHLAPFFGTCDVCYLPQGGVVGLSKLARVVAHFAQRLQVQERLTCQIADYLTEHVSRRGVGVIMRATHFCMVSRGVKQPEAVTVTSALRGALFDDAKARAEFLHLTREAP